MVGCSLGDGRKFDHPFCCIVRRDGQGFIVARSRRIKRFICVVSHANIELAGEC